LIIPFLPFQWFFEAKLSQVVEHTPMISGIKWLCLALLWATGASGQVAVIAHKGVPLDTLSRAQLLDFYSCDIKYWNKALPVVVIDLKPQTEAKTLFYKFLGMPASRMKSVWLRKMLLGEGEPPAAMASEEEVLKKVASTRGALAFISMDQINTQIKTLLIIPRKHPA
jgi:ABC-type phosphate transport system substrate-binding protein